MELKHIAIIMDGNGRWAKRKGLTRSEGHRAGSENARRITRAAGRLKIPYLTLYALSTENLYRPQQELDGLMALMRHYLTNEVPELLKNNIRLRVIGDRKYLPADVKRLMEKAELETSQSYKMTLALAVCYGGRDDIVRAVRELADKTDLSKLSEEKLASALDTSDMPDPDLIIRTGGDHRISNFLIWQAAYSELYMTKTLWPDFSPAHLKRAVESFAHRERRFGKTDETVALGPATPKKKRGKLR